MPETGPFESDTPDSPQTGVAGTRGELDRRLSRLLTNLPGVAYRCANDEHWTMEFLSEGSRDLTGYGPDELISNPTLSFTDLVRPDRRFSLREQVLQSLEQREHFELEYPIRTKSGEEKWVWERGVGVRSSNGQLVALEGYIADITERKQCEEGLQRSEERLRLMVEHLPTGAVFRQDNRLLLNKAAEEITGYLRSELSTADDWFKKLYGGRYEERRSRYEESRNSGFPVRRTLPITRKDGEIRWVEFAAYAYEKGEVWLLHDITGLKSTEEELRGYQAQLRSLASELSLAEDRERRRLAMELHDGLGQALSMAHVKLELLGEVQMATESAEMLEEARQLIDQAIGDTRSLTFELSSPILHQVGFVPALQQLCEDMATQYGGRFFVEEDEYPKPLSSERRMVLFRCVRELLINVAKHADADEAKVSVTTHGNRLRIAVEDDGVGFATSQIGRGLTPSGGFGLFNINEYLSHLGGSMQIHSAPAHGTRVLVEAPLQTDQSVTARTNGSEKNG